MLHLASEGARYSLLRASFLRVCDMVVARRHCGSNSATTEAGSSPSSRAHDSAIAMRANVAMSSPARSAASAISLRASGDSASFQRGVTLRPETFGRGVRGLVMLPQFACRQRRAEFPAMTGHVGARGGCSRTPERRARGGSALARSE